MRQGADGRERDRLGLMVMTGADGVEKGEKVLLWCGVWIAPARRMRAFMADVLGFGSYREQKSE